MSLLLLLGSGAVLCSTLSNWVPTRYPEPAKAGYPTQPANPRTPGLGANLSRGLRGVIRNMHGTTDVHTMNMNVYSSHSAGTSEGPQNTSDSNYSEPFEYSETIDYSEPFEYSAPIEYSELCYYSALYCKKIDVSNHSTWSHRNRTSLINHSSHTGNCDCITSSTLMDSQARQSWTGLGLVVSMLVAANALGLIFIFGCMMPHGSNNRAPPLWAPDMEPRYTFGEWQRDVLLWSITNEDMEPHRQAALILQALRGGARELTRDIPDNIILRGAIVNGTQVDGVTYIMNVLAERYGQLGEESRLKAIKELMDFDRHHNEKIDDLITRFEITRNRARHGGQFVMSYEGLTYKLLRACRVNEHQFMNLLLPTNGRMPTTEREMFAMYIALRRMGHILERSHDNIAQGLRGAHGPVANAYTWNEVPDTEDSKNQRTFWSGSSNDNWAYRNHGHSGWNTEQTGWNLGTWQEQVYHEADLFDSGTDTDTESSIGDTRYDYSDIPAGASEQETAEHLFWAYQQAKGRYRKFMRKPVRRVRRFLRRKGKGKGKHPGFYLTGLSDTEVDQVFFAPKGKGKGKGKRSSGKGKGRRQNPRGPDGQIMKCRKCNSIEHFQKDCPHNRGGPPGGSQSTPGNYFVDDSLPAPGPLDSVFGGTYDRVGPTFMITEITDSGERRLDSYVSVPHGNQEQSASAMPVDQVHINDPWVRQSNNHPTGNDTAWSNWMEPRIAQEIAAVMNNGEAGLLPRYTPGQATSSNAVPATAIERHTRRLPAWASLPNAQTARGRDTWQPEPERPVAISLYKENFEFIEPMHDMVANRFHDRKNTRGHVMVVERSIDVTAVCDLQQGTLQAMTRIQQENKARRDNKVLLRKRNERARIAAENATSGGHNSYQGEVNKCVICLFNFNAGDRVARLVCRHVLHEDCLTNYLVHSTVEDPVCPECRGTTKNPKNFRYISENQFVVTPAVSETGSDDERRRGQNPFSPVSNSGVATPEIRSGLNPNNPAESASNSLGSSWSQITRQDQQQFFTWWQCEINDACYHGNTRLADGRQGLLIDPGAWNNLVGENWAQEMARKALMAGHKPQQNRMDRAMCVAGVGVGTNRAEWEVRLPIALGPIGAPVTLHEFKAPTVGGQGKELPALLGLQSMSRMKGVLEMTDGEEYLTFPGMGGYSIEWSPGTKRYKLTRATSGHLILPCDEFDKVLQTKGGLEEPKVTFYTGTHKAKKETKEIGTQTEKQQEFTEKCTNSLGKKKAT